MKIVDKTATVHDGDCFGAEVMKCVTETSECNKYPDTLTPLSEVGTDLDEHT